MTYAIKTLNNMNDYTKGYFNGRGYEQDRILAILNDYPDLVLPDDLVTRIQEGDDRGHVCLTRASLELVKADSEWFGRRKALTDVSNFLRGEAETLARPPVLNMRRLVTDLAVKVANLD